MKNDRSTRISILPAVGGILVCFLVLGCQNNRGAQQSDLLKTKEEVQKLTDRVKDLESRVFALELSKNPYATASFDPTGDRVFQRVDSNIGSFLVVLDNVEPYLDGQKITLLIGNPNNVSFDGFKLKAKWGTRYPAGKQTPEEWQKAFNAYNDSAQEKEFDLTNALEPGAWNKVQFKIAPAKADVFGRLEVGITTTKALLAHAR